MSKSSISELKNPSESDNTNVWDDKLLIKAYDSSVKLASEELAKRIARATNNQNAEPQPTDGSSKSVEIENVENPVYAVGSYVRATFDDGCDYEAKILSINDEEATCLLKYIGYDNEQEVRLADLVPSWGKKARRLQFARAKQGVEAAMDESLLGKPKAAGSGIKKNKNRHGNEFAFGAVPPPPPMPPMLARNLEDSEHLSAMLMSWYMSGYYTGVYQGIQIAKSKSKSHK